MKHGSTLFLRAVIILIGVAALALCAYLLPLALKSEGVGFYRPILLGLYLPAIPFLFALHQGLRLLSYIDSKTAFSELSIKALKNIKYCATVISLFFLVGMPYIFFVAQLDDAPGVVLIGLIFTFAPMIIAVFAAVLQKLFQNAMNIKSENELIV